jgi:ATP-dependent Clp protease protease subunit
MFSKYISKKKKQVDQDLDPLEKLKSLMGGGDAPDKEKNHIYFYTDVDQYSCLDLNRKINDLNKELLKYAIEFDCPPPNIYLHINSNGGCLLSAFSTVDTILNSRVPIISIVEGCAASAATIISIACNKRFMTQNSFMLIHQLSTGVSGKYEEIKDDFMNDTKFMEQLYNLYKENTTMSNKKIKEVLKHDIWWDYKECLENGLVDGLWDSNTTSLNINNLFNGNHFNTGNTSSLRLKNQNIEEEPTKKKRKK